MEIKPGEGIGELKLGMSKSEIIKILGEPDEQNDPKNYLSYYEKGICFMLFSNRVKTIFLYSGRKGGYEDGTFKCFNGSLNEGIGFDTRYETVIKDFGAADEAADLTSAPIPAKYVSYNSGISFDFIEKTGEIITITIVEKKQPLTPVDFSSINLPNDKDNKIALVQKKLIQLQKMVKSALDTYDPDQLGDIDALKTLAVQKIDSQDIESFEKKYTINLPSSYTSFIQSLGAITIGNDELVLRNPLRLGISLGELIEERIPDHGLNNFTSGHYHDFMIIAEYGYFPTEDKDYSAGLAFNKKKPEEMIEYACDEIWLASTPEDRKAGSERDVFFQFLEDKLNRLIVRVEEAVQELG